MSTFNIQDAIYIDADTQNVGIGDTTPSYPLDVTGDINTTTDFNVGGVQVLSATALGSAVVSSSLTSVGTLSALTVSGDLNATLTTAAQTNVTSVGTLSALTVSGNLNATLTTAAQTNVTSVGTLSALTVSGNLNATLTTAAQPNVTSVGTLSSLTVSGALDVSGDIDCNSNDITNVDNISFTSATIKGHMIPDTDDTYDIGSAQFKIRDMYVSDNSLWVGDSHKVSISGGKMKFRKRISATVPAAITAAGGDEAGALTHAGKISLSLMKLHHWKAYMRTLSDQSGATIQDIFRDNAADYIEQSASDNWLETGTKTFNTIGNVGIGTADPSALLSLHYEPESSQGLKELLRLSWNDGSYDTLKGDGTKISFNTSNVNNSPGNVEGGYIGVMKANAVEANKACDYTVALNNGTSVVERLRILSTGYVGIGDSTPSYELDVTGDINLTGDLRINGTVQTFGGGSSVWSEASSEAYYMGNVGIGTNNPGYLLDMTGTSVGGILARIQGGILLQADENMVLRSSANNLDDTNSLLWQNSGSAYTWRIGRRYNSSYETSHQGSLVISGGTANGDYEALTDIMTFRQSNTFVGIKKRDPAYQLDVVGDINLTGDLRINGTIQTFGGSVWSEASSEASYMGNVGIGIANPTSKLHIVHSSSTIEPHLQFGGADGTYIDFAGGGRSMGVFNGGALFMGFNCDYNASTNTFQQNYSANSVVMKMNATGVYFGTHDMGGLGGGGAGSTFTDTTRLFIKADGNVGIGTETPTSKLDVVGDIVFGVNSKLKLDQSSWQSCGNIELTSGSGVFGFHGTGVETLGIYVDGECRASSILSDYDITSSGGILLKTGLAATATRPTVGGSVGAYEIRAYGTNGTLSNEGFMRLSAGGGTGSTNMSYIDIAGYNTNTDMDDNIVFGTRGNERMRINGTGNVGIGTNNPSYQLDVRGNMRLGDGTTTEQDIRYISANGDWQLGTNDAGNGTSGNHFFLYEAGSYRFTVQKGTGNVGIGQQSPTGKLHISGSVTNTTSYSTSSPLLRLSQTNAATPWDFTAIVLETGGYNHTIGMSLNTLQLKAKGSAGYGEMEFIVGAGITTAMVIDYTGNVGIGTNSPTFNLEVVGYGGSLSTNLYGYHHAANAWYNHSGSTWNTSTEQIGARFHSGIIAQSMYIMSDERIKTDIIEIEDDEALVQLRQLKPKKYNYTDVSTYGENQVYGFIAQEVREVLPTSCTLISNYIPNIQVSANISSIEENIVENFEENSCVLTLGVEHNLIVNDMITCRTSSGESIDDIEVTEIIDIYSIRINKTFTSEQSTFTNEEDDFVEENVIFVYGKKVDDFHNLNKDTIWTVATAALQEVDRQLQAEKTKVANLESELAIIKAHLGL